MMLIKTDSSVVTAYGYDNKSSELTLVVRGQKQVYQSAPPELFVALRDAESKGKFYNTIVKKSGLHYEKFAI